MRLLLNNKNYIHTLLLISLKKTGLSSGNTKTKDYTAKNAWVIIVKKSIPFLVYTPRLVPSIVW